METTVREDKVLYTTPDGHRLICWLADETHRTIKGTIQWLAESELERRGIDPETLTPVNSVEDAFDDDDRRALRVDDDE